MQPTDNLHAYYAAHAPAVPDWFPPLRRTENPLDHLVRWRHEYAAAMVKKGASQ